MIYIVYLDGQIGMPFDNEEVAVNFMKDMHNQYFDAYVIRSEVKK